ncbi:PR domain zinc finger protein 5-like [Anopheles darlingi]|uniref:PR domain zinc finger protein 5-like n=1 Tax=Anopheles darlingi TaxID=43151 RepID=UPI00210043CC|nr:PR domain zinc finger protein 5-like [Anopheles darlingi]
MTIFRLEEFPHVCRLCMQSAEGTLTPIDGTLVDLINEIAAFCIPEDVLHLTPSGVCGTCAEEFENFLAYRNRLVYVTQFSYGLAQARKGFTEVLEDLFNDHQKGMTEMLEDLQLVNGNAREHGVHELLNEFEDYAICALPVEAQHGDDTKQNLDEPVAMEYDEAYDVNEEDCAEYLDPTSPVVKETTIVTEIEPLGVDEVDEVIHQPCEEEEEEQEDIVLANDSIKELAEDEQTIEYTEEVVIRKDEEDEDEAEAGAEGEATQPQESDAKPAKKGLTKRTRSSREPEASQNGKKDQHCCPKCDFVTVYRRSFLMHLERHKKTDRLPQRSFICKRCQSAFATRKELIKHKRSEHRDFMCDTCGLAFEQKFALDMHRTRHDQKRQFKCDYCPLEYYTKPEKLLHIKQAHLKVFEVKCPDCGLLFKTKNELNQHVKSHTDTRTYMCSVCKFGFKSQTHLSRHTKSVHQEVRYKCDYCSQSYCRKDKLRMHIEKQHNIQTYFVCDICLQSYNTRSKLDDHKAHHLNPKDQQCGTCLSAFLTQQDFDEHRCITYRENYICCDRDFKFHFHYNKHMFLVHGEHTNVRVKPTEGLLMGQFRAMRKQEERCAKCGQEFPTRTFKKQHMASCDGPGYYVVEYIDNGNATDQLPPIESEST